MTSIVSIFNSVITLLFGVVYSVLKGLGPFWSLVGISFLGGILMVWIFGKVSNQDAIKVTRSRMSAELIALRLFKDDLAVFFDIQYRILIWTLKYLRQSLVPMLILMVPVMIILIQLNLHYAMRPLPVGEQTLVNVTVRSASSLQPDTEISLAAGEGIVVETEGVRIPETREISWRVRGGQPGDYDLLVKIGDETMSKKMSIGDRQEGVSSLRSGADWLTNLLYPGEAPIPKQSAVESIEIRYPDLEISFFGWGMNWLILFFVLSMVFAFKGVLGVHI